MHLIDHARQRIERTYRRPLGERLLRSTLAFVMPHTALFRVALALGALAGPFSALLPPRLRSLVQMARTAREARKKDGPGTLDFERRLPPPQPGEEPPNGPQTVRRIRRVAMLTGCVQPALRPQINEATQRVLGRHGVEVVIANGTGCCGALVHHLGREHESRAQAKADIDAWMREIEGEGLDAIIVTASGCGTMLKDYGFIFRDDPVYAAKAARVSALARDVTEELAKLDLTTIAPPCAAESHRVAYHSACSLQHGQKLHTLAPDLLRRAGFTVVDVPEGHICCGSAGTYSLLQPEMSAQLRDRKARNIESVAPTIIATGNIGCIMQIAQATRIPIVHTVELLDWATGGPRPAQLG
jgi:glycolate oxidase iron-sulfur subunit